MDPDASGGIRFKIGIINSEYQIKELWVLLSSACLFVYKSGGFLWP